MAAGQEGFGAIDCAPRKLCPRTARGSSAFSFAQTEVPDARTDRTEEWAQLRHASCHTGHWRKLPGRHGAANGEPSRLRLIEFQHAGPLPLAEKSHLQRARGSCAAAA